MKLKNEVKFKVFPLFRSSLATEYTDSSTSTCLPNFIEIEKLYVDLRT